LLLPQILRLHQLLRPRMVQSLPLQILYCYYRCLVLELFPNLVLVYNLRRSCRSLLLLVYVRHFRIVLLVPG
jgi:hypothetical protein